MTAAATAFHHEARPLMRDGAPLPVAFYAPMKPANHPVPSGDREIARQLLAVLEEAGASPMPISRLRVLDLKGDVAVQERLAAAASEEVARIVAARAGGAQLWLTYHTHYKAPDLIGPAVTRALGLPYAIVEPSISPKRREGPWSRFAAASDAAIEAADRLFWTTARDRPALEAAGHGERLTHLPPFLDPGPPPPRLRAAASRPLRLLTVGMMRSGDKAESYRRLARGLRRLPGPWRLDIAGDGPLRAETEALFAPFAGPLRAPPDQGGLGDVAVRFLGTLENGALRDAMTVADLMVWPGVGEGIGMAWLEAQAAGLPVVAEDGLAARDVIAGGRLAAPGDPVALAQTIVAAAAERPALSTAARDAVLARHTRAAAAATLGSALAALVP
ncbi:MAG: glycosyltransferase family 4 protein [Pseudomonadota bacterium]